MLTVVTTATRDYARAWVFPSLARLSCRVVCLLHPEDRRALPANVERHPYDAPGVLFQDGRFLGAVPGISDDVPVVLADADAVFQRDFTVAERDTLDTLGDGVALGYNMRPGQRGAEEYRELRPKQPLEEAAARLGLPADVLRGCWIYNTGLMAARARTWRRLRGRFAETFGEVNGNSLLALHSWPQYFLCLLFCLHGIPVTELGYETHSHGHFPLTKRHALQKGRLLYGGRPVLFAHNIPEVARDGC